jgi:hypothetical protein
VLGVGSWDVIANEQSGMWQSKGNKALVFFIKNFPPFRAGEKKI